jgi:hypothetical protein
MHIVGSAQLVPDREQDCIRLRDRLVLSQLLDQDIRLSSVITTEDRSCSCVDEANRVLFLTSSSEIARSRSSINAKMLRLTETRGVCVWPASFHAARYPRIWAACWTWNGSPVSSFFRL